MEKVKRRFDKFQIWLDRNRLWSLSSRYFISLVPEAVSLVGLQKLYPWMVTISCLCLNSELQVIGLQQMPSLWLVSRTCFIGRIVEAVTLVVQQKLAHWSDSRSCLIRRIIEAVSLVGQQKVSYWLGQQMLSHWSVNRSCLICRLVDSGSLVGQQILAHWSGQQIQAHWSDSRSYLINRCAMTEFTYTSAEPAQVVNVLRCCNYYQS